MPAGARPPLFSEGPKNFGGETAQPRPPRPPPPPTSYLKVWIRHCDIIYYVKIKLAKLTRVARHHR